MKKLAWIITFMLTISVNAIATTWSPSKHKCPICSKTNTYYEIMSYGGYIYQWPTKFQYVFWPLIDQESVYCCPDCHFATYMWDFDSIPNEKKDTIELFLKTVKLDKKYKDYRSIPMTTRLLIAENVYNILGRDDEFWCKFYRVLGYHFDVENKKSQAQSSRFKALELAKTMVNDTARIDQKKENLFIVAAMYNYTSQKDSALKYLDYTINLKYANKNMKEENATGLDEYLTDLIVQYRDLLLKGE